MTQLAARAIAIYAKTHGEAEAYAKLTDWERAKLQAIEEMIRGAQGRGHLVTLYGRPVQSQSESHTFKPLSFGDLAMESHRKKLEPVE
jgi:hypothetical protein